MNERWRKKREKEQGNKDGRKGEGEKEEGPRTRDMKKKEGPSGRQV